MNIRKQRQQKKLENGLGIIEMSNFSSKIKDIERRINQLKTLGLSSSSSLNIAEYEITLHFQIVATRIGAGGEVFDAGSSQEALIRITTKDNRPALICLRYISPLQIGARTIYIDETLMNIGNYDYAYNCVIFGDEADKQALQNGQTLPVQNYKYKILATSEITSINITYRDVPIYDGRQP